MEPIICKVGKPKHPLQGGVKFHEFGEPEDPYFTGADSGLIRVPFIIAEVKGFEGTGKLFSNISACVGRIECVFSLGNPDGLYRAFKLPITIKGHREGELVEVVICGAPASRQKIEVYARRMNVEVVREIPGSDYGWDENAGKTMDSTPDVVSEFTAAYNQLTAVAKKLGVVA